LLANGLSKRIYFIQQSNLYAGHKNKNYNRKNYFFKYFFSFFSASGALLSIGGFFKLPAALG